MIRTATQADVHRLLEIYGYYVQNTAITFEYEVPCEAEFCQRIQNTLSQFPYLVYQLNGKILGFAYAGRFHPRKSCDWAVEASVYVDKDARGQGIGQKLYAALEECLGLQGYTHLCAGIAYAETEDAYLTNHSVRFHAQMGYRQCAHFHQCAYKFGRWYDLVWMEKNLSMPSNEPESPVPFPKIKSEDL